MRNRPIIAVTAVGMLLALATAPGAEAKKRPCKSRGQGTIVANEFARVFIANRADDDGEYYACKYGQKRDVRLAVTVIDTAGRGGDFFQLSEPYGPHQYVAAAQEDCGIDYCDYTAKTINLDNFHRVRRAYGHSLMLLLLVRSGSLALLEETSYPWENTRSYRVRKVEASGTSVLDQGPDIDPGSLAVTDHWVYWRRGGTTYTAPLK